MHTFWKVLIQPLFEAAGVKSIVEVGAADGLHTEELAGHALRNDGLLQVIDPVPLFDEGDFRARFGPHFVLHRERSLNVLPSLKEYDAILLDGDHNWYTVFNELQEIHQAHRNRDLSRYPLILLHDTSWPYGRRDCYDDPESIPEGFCHGFFRLGMVKGQCELAETGGVNNVLLNADHEGGPRNGVLTAAEDFLVASGGEFELFMVPLNFGLTVLVTRQRLDAQPHVEQFLRESTSEPGMAALQAHLSHPDDIYLAPRDAAPIVLTSRAPRPGDTPEKLSMVIIIYNMRREAARSLLALSTRYQRGIAESEYEVIVIENGSTQRLDPSLLEGLGNNFHYHYVENASRSPLPALNLGVRLASGTQIGLMLDGAHVLTPGVLHYARRAFDAFESPVVAVRYFYLGSEAQNFSVSKGYNQAVEDELLRSIDWPSDGYRLFEIGAISAGRKGWFQRMTESNCFFMHRSLFEALGGYDERFDTPAGALGNTDLFERALTAPDVTPCFLLGEGCFHQFHNGTTTSVPARDVPQLLLEYDRQYQAIRGKCFVPKTLPLRFLGHMPPQALTAHDMLRNQLWDDIHSQAESKEREISRLQRACAERLQVINRLSCACAEKEEAIAALHAAAEERLVLIRQLSAQAEELRQAAAMADALHLEGERKEHVIASLRGAAEERLELIQQLHASAAELQDAAKRGVLRRLAGGAGIIRGAATRMFKKDNPARGNGADHRKF